MSFHVCALQIFFYISSWVKRNKQSRYLANKTKLSICHRKHSIIKANTYCQGNMTALTPLKTQFSFFHVLFLSEIILSSQHGESVEVKVIAVSKWNLSKTRLALTHYRQFSPINNLTLSSFYLLVSLFLCLYHLPLFEKPRGEGILPLCSSTQLDCLYSERNCNFAMTQSSWRSLFK